MPDAPEPDSYPVAHFGADAALSPDARRKRHGDAFLVLMPGVLARPVGDVGTAIVAGSVEGELAPAGFAICPVRRRDRAEGLTVSVGRTAGNDLVIAHVSVSKSHAHFKRYQDVYVLQDHGSRNGTFVDDFPVPAKGKPQLVRSGNRVRFGSAETLFLRADAFWEFVGRMSRRHAAAR
jgi:hypothetical protein